jgi:hypothetical protein
MQYIYRSRIHSFLGKYTVQVLELFSLVIAYAPILTMKNTVKQNFLSPNQLLYFINRRPLTEKLDLPPLSISSYHYQNVLFIYAIIAFFATGNIDNISFIRTYFFLFFFFFFFFNDIKYCLHFQLPL